MHCTRFVLVLSITLTLVACAGTGPHLEVPTPGEERYTALQPVAIHAVSPSEVVVVGSCVRPDGTPEGLILTTEDGARTWRRRAIEVHDLDRVHFQSVFFADRLRGWVAGIRVDDLGRTRPVVYRTRDGGNHWWQCLVAQDPDLVVSEMHDLSFTSDREGQVTARYINAATLKELETTFLSDDSGRSWVATTFRAEPKEPFVDQTVAYIDSKRGFRLMKSPFPDVTLLETTASGGQDWMPIAEITLTALPTYY